MNIKKLRGRRVSIKRTSGRWEHEWVIIDCSKNNRLLVMNERGNVKHVRAEDAKPWVVANLTLQRPDYLV